MSLANRKFKLEEHPDEWRDTGFGGSPDGGQPTLKHTQDPARDAEPINLVNPGHNYLPPEEDRTFSSRRRDAAPAEPVEELVPASDVARPEILAHNPSAAAPPPIGGGKS